MDDDDNDDDDDDSGNDDDDDETAVATTMDGNDEQLRRHNTFHLAVAAAAAAAAALAAVKADVDRRTGNKTKKHGSNDDDLVHRSNLPVLIFILYLLWPLLTLPLLQHIHFPKLKSNIIKMCKFVSSWCNCRCCSQSFHSTVLLPLMHQC
jgi:hypothetical protein